MKRSGASGASAGETALSVASERDLRIREITCQIVDAPTIRRHKLSNTQVDRQSFVLVRLRLDNGAVGIGEGATLGGPKWAEESPESIQSVIDTYLAPACLGADARAPEAVSLRLAKAASRNFAAKAAIEAALYDALGKSLELPAAELLGGRVRDRMEVLWALASGDADQEIEEARAKLAARTHRRFKIKIGFQSPQADLARLRKIADGVGATAELIVDINQGWCEADTIRYLPQLGELGVALIEQPLPAGQLEALARVAARSPAPIMVDEACFTAADVARAGALGAGSVLSLKLVKSGGMLELKRAAAVAEAHGLQLYGGCLLESGVGAAAHLAVFATLPRLHWGTEQFGPRILARDLARPSLTYEDFHVRLPDGPGLGVDLDEDAVAEMARRG